MPRTYGYDPFGLNTGNKQTAGGTAPCSFTALHPVTWVTSCFTGVKGSMNYYFTFNNTSNNDIYALTAQRYPVGVGTPSSNSIASSQLVTTTDVSVLSNYLTEHTADGSQGMALVVPSVTPTLAVVAPNYNQYLFNGTSLYNTSSSSQYDGAAVDMITVTATLDISATVPPNCVFGTNTNITFGAYDPIDTNATSGSDLTDSGEIKYTCTYGISPYITLNQGNNPGTNSSNESPKRRLKKGSENAYLSYNIYTDVDRTTVWGNTGTTGTSGTGNGIEQTVTLYGKIAKGQNVPVGTGYTDTVTATISY